MADDVSREQRSRMMAGIKGKDTKPELVVRKALFRRGFRYRLHRKDLPGTPDIVFPKYHAVILVNGCFWHCHECELFKWPKKNAMFWRTKILNNKTRDARNMALLRDAGWRVTTLWECSIKRKPARRIEREIDRLEAWLKEKPRDWRY